MICIKDGKANKGTVGFELNEWSILELYWLTSSLLRAVKFKLLLAAVEVGKGICASMAAATGSTVGIVSFRKGGPGGRVIYRNARTP